MILSKHTACQSFEIWEPRYKDKKVLLAKQKVGTHNSVKFIGHPKKGHYVPQFLQGEWYISGSDVHMCDVETNGTIDCYAVPIGFLEPLERKN